VVKDGEGCTISEVERDADDVPEVPTDVKVSDEATSTDVTKADKDACKAGAEQYLTLDLVGATADDGKVFTSTWDDGQPLTARLGASQLIAGLESELADMKVGARRQIVVPAALAYGAEGNEAQGIGPDEDLVFVVDLLSTTDSPRYCNPATVPEGTREGKPTEINVPAEAPTDKVVTTVLEPGDGPEAKKDSYLTVDYVGVSCASGQQFDSSWDREDPITIALVDAEPTQTAFSVIPGWSDGLVGQKEGSLVQVDIPFEQAYGTAGSPPAIGPSDPLTFVVKIIDVADEPPPDPAADSTTTAPAG